MDAIFQTTPWSVFSWKKMFEFRLRFYRSSFPMVQLIIFLIGSDNGLAPIRRQAIIWANRKCQDNVYIRWHNDVLGHRHRQNTNDVLGYRHRQYVYLTQNNTPIEESIPRCNILHIVLPTPSRWQLPRKVTILRRVSFIDIKTLRLTHGWIITSIDFCGG